MTQLLPHLHPIFVHFTVALLLVATLFYLLALIDGRRRPQWLTVGRWDLWLGAAATVGTALTGLYAFNTVAHDAPSHAAMTDHRNWAVATLVLFLLLAMWTLMRARAGRTISAPIVGGLLIASLVLGSTAWRGGALVYQYGLGVRSLPAAEPDDRHHAHSGTAELQLGQPKRDHQVSPHTPRTEANHGANGQAHVH